MDFIVDNAGTIGLVFFFTTFVIVIIRLYVFGNKKKYDSYAKIPLDINEEDG